MTPASKHLDIVMGIDIHFIQYSGPVPPLPIPHPFIGLIFDAQDYDLPPLSPGGMAMYLASKGAMKALSNVEAFNDAMSYLDELKKDSLAAVGMNPNTPSTIKVNGLPRTKAGTRGKALPKHFPMGGAFALPALVINECEAYMGSRTVLADSEPFAYAQLPVLSCSDIGMPVPPRKGKPTSIGMFMPTSVVIPIPLGPPVFVGGDPITSKSAIIRNLAGAGLRFLKRSKTMKRASKRLHEKADAIMDKRGVKNRGVRNAVHRSLCAVTGHPVDIATGKVFTETVDFELPGPIPLKWERVWYSTSTLKGSLGHGWHHSYDMVLTYDPSEPELIGVGLADGRVALFPILKVGESHFDRKERLQLSRDEKGYYLRDADRLNYRFTAEMIKAPELHLLESIQDDNGFSIDFRYNEKGDLIGINDSANRDLVLEVNENGQITKIQAPHPNKAEAYFDMIEYRYDEPGNLVEVLDALKKSFCYEYEKFLLVKETNRNGFSFYFEYDGEDHTARCLRTFGDRVPEWGESGIYDHKLTYYIDEKKTVVRNSLGYETVHYYNDLGLVYKVVDAKGHTSLTHYGTDAEVIAETNELGETTQYTYDQLGNRTCIITPDGATSTYFYDDNLLVAAIDPVGGKWKWTYDEKGNLIKQVNSLDQKIEYAYQNGLMYLITSNDGGTTFLRYDEHFNHIQTINANNQAFSWIYDYIGREVKAIDLKGNAEEFKYNLLGQVLEVKTSDGNHRFLRYDPEGNLILARDKQQEVRYLYAGMGKLRGRIEADTKVEFTYDTEERLVTVTNEHGLGHHFIRDQNGEVIQEIGFDQTQKLFKRDAKGQIEEIVSATGSASERIYDAMGRILEVIYSDGTKVSYRYRADGAMIEATNDTISIKFERDLLGRVINEDQGGISVHSQFNPDGFRYRVFSSLGANLLFDRGNYGDVMGVTANEVWSAKFTRDSLGLEEERILPGNVRSRIVRDTLGRPVKQETLHGLTSLKVRTYKWDVNERLISLNRNKLSSIDFQHDVFGNLEMAQYDNEGIHESRWTDEVGNVFRQKDRKDREYGLSGQILRTPTAQYKYAADGNLIEKTTQTGDVWQYEWDAAGRLKLVIRPDRNTVTFSYDAFGRRIAKTFLGRTTRWVWDGNVPLHEWIIPAEDFFTPILRTEDEKSLRLKSMAVLGVPEQPTSSNAQLITWVHEPDSFSILAKIQGESQFSVVTDYLGIPLTMLNETGAKVWSADMGIYGNLQSLHGDVEAMPFRYPGQYEDLETGLFYNRHRYYDPDNGTYISRDPIGLEVELNPYRYVGDPLIIIDPFGLKPQRGGCYGRVRQDNEGGEVNHMPPNSVSGLSRYSGPAIWMTKRDHRKTKSWGSSKKAREHRKKQQQLIQQGKFKEAFEMDVRDVRKKFGNKYDQSIKEARAYGRANNWFQ